MTPIVNASKQTPTVTSLTGDNLQQKLVMAGSESPLTSQQQLPSTINPNSLSQTPTRGDPQSKSEFPLDAHFLFVFLIIVFTL